MTTTTSKPARPTPRARKQQGAHTVAHLSVAERIARGKAARAEVPRSSHAIFEPMSDLDVWYSRLEIESLVQELAPQFKQRMVQRTEKALAKARTKDSMAAFSKLTQSVNGEVRIVDQSPLIVPIEQLAPGQERDEMFEALHQLLRGYRQTLEFDRRVLLEQYRLTDFARKVVGVGSVGSPDNG
jgi:glutamyl-tRNA reductase